MNKFKEKTVNKTVQLNLCISCGLCVSICDYHAIELTLKKGIFVPRIKENCTLCGKCLRICPGVMVDFLAIYGDQGLPFNIFTGNEIKSFVMWAKNKEFRFNGASGGVITQLLTLFIENGDYDYVSYLIYEVLDPNPAKIGFTNSIEKICKAANSKYLPVRIDEVVTKIEKEPEKKYVIVGTPCSIFGIKKYLHLKNISEQKIVYLGLFCAKVMNYNLLSYYKNKYSRKNDSLVGLEYRNKEDGGWPGNTKLTFSDRVQYVDRKIRTELKDYFEVNRCRYCIDKFNQFADISFGDCYIKGEESYEGKSNIIIRTQKGIEIFQRYKDYFWIKETSADMIYNSQHVSQKEKNLKIALTLKKISMYPDLETNKHKGNIFIKFKNKMRKNKLGELYSKVPFYYLFRIELSKLFNKVIKKIGRIIKQTKLID